MGEAAYRLAKKLADQVARSEKPGAHLASAAPPPSEPTTLHSKTAGPTETDPGNVYPPDPSVAISTSQIVVTVNNTYNVYDRTRHALLNLSLQAWLGTGDTVTGARVVYDPVWKHWTLFATDTDSPSMWIAISKTPNALGNYWIYHIGFPYAAGDIMDYPMLGISQNTLMFTANHFTGGVYQAANMFAVSKDRLYNGLGWGAGLFGTGGGTMAPPIVEDTSPKAYFLFADGGTTLDVWEGADLATNASTITLKSQIPVNYSIPPSAHQLNTSERLDTLDARFEGPSSQYVDGNSGDIVLWNAHTRGLGSFPAPYFYEIDATTGTLVQQGSFFFSATSDDFNASIVANTQGEAFVTWNATDVPNHRNAFILYSGQQPGDPAGQMGAKIPLIPNSISVTGNPESPGVQFWGSHSGIALDPVAPAACSDVPNRRALFINEYGASRTAWATEFAIAGYC